MIHPTLTLDTPDKVAEFLDEGSEFALLQSQGRLWLMFLADNEEYYAVSVPQEGDPSEWRESDDRSVIHPPVVQVENLTLPLVVLWAEDSYWLMVDLYEPPTPADVADAFDGHRLEPFGPASSKCTCGKILYGGGGLTMIPGEAAYREHLGQLAVDQIRLVTDVAPRQLGATIEAVLKARTWMPSLADDPQRVVGQDGVTMTGHQLARAVCEQLRTADQ